MVNFNTFTIDIFLQSVDKIIISNTIICDDLCKLINCAQSPLVVILTFLAVTHEL